MKTATIKARDQWRSKLEVGMVLECVENTIAAGNVGRKITVTKIGVGHVIGKMADGKVFHCNLATANKDWSFPDYYSARYRIGENGWVTWRILPHEAPADFDAMTCMGSAEI